MNASVNETNPPGQVDDNMGSCPLAAPAVKLDITKTADTANPRVGDDVTYTITVTNSGDPASGVVVNDTLPAGMTYDSYSGTDWTCTNNAQAVSCSYSGVLLNGASSSLEIVASVNDNTSLWGDTLTNTVCTSSVENATLVCDDANITVYTPLVSLGISKTASNPTPYVDATIFYTIAVTNNGPDSASNIAVQDILPSGVAYVDYDSSGGWTCVETNSIVDCSLATLAAGETTQLFIIVDVSGTAGTVYTNTATVVSDENPTPLSSTADITPVIRPVPATLTVEKGVSDTTPLTSDTIIYGIIISNAGQSAATNVVFTDTLPAGVSYVDGDNNTSLGGTFDVTNGDISWNGFNLPAGESTIIRITVTVDSGIGETVTNTACADHLDNRTDVCSAIDFTVRAPVVELLMDKSVDNETPRVGDNVTYTLVVTNNGSDTATNVTVNDPLPGGLVPGASNATIGSYVDPTWFIGTLAPGASAELNITATIVGPDTEGTLISNVATVSATENPTPVSDDANLTVYTPAVILTIQKVADQNFPPEGADITYTIIVNNIGNDNATGVTVTDTLPEGVTFLSAGGNGWTCDETIYCTNDALILQPGVPSSFDINVTVNPDTAGTTLTNEAYTSAEQNDTLVYASNSITVNENLDLVVTKSVNNAAPAEGETIFYTITVVNNGPITATGVEITENIVELTGLTSISAVADVGTFDGDETWSVGTLNAGQTATLTVTATVASGASGSYINFATLSGLDQDDIDPDSNFAQATISVAPVQPDCGCDNISSDGSPALNVVTGTVMILLTLMIGLYFVRREEQLKRNER